MDSLCHPWFTTANLSYRFPIFETSATALCGTTGIISALVPLSIRVLEAGNFSSTQLIDSWPLLAFHGTETTEWSSGTHAQFLLSIHALLVQNFKFFVIEFGDIIPMFWKFSSFSACWKSGWAKYLWLRWGVWYTTGAGNRKLSRRRGKNKINVNIYRSLSLITGGQKSVPWHAICERFQHGIPDATSWRIDEGYGPILQTDTSTFHK